MSTPKRRSLSFFLVAMALVAAFGLGAGGLQAFERARAEIEAGIYRDRLASLSRDYSRLVSQYNDAVSSSAVTELVVADGRVSVRVRDRLGRERVVATPFDPSREIYVDFAVVEGRLWIRRVFDESTPPREGVVIDPALASVDWDAVGGRVGKAVYRSLGEGVWEVSVTGQGSLGLVRVEGERRPLAEAPAVRSFESVEAEARERVEGITLGEVWRRVFGG